MRAENIMCGIHYRSAHQFSVYKDYSVQRKYNLNFSEIIGQETVSIPFHEKLSDQDINYIIEKCIQCGT